MNTNLSFACDYMEGCHPAILEKLTETNLIKTPGYGLDDYTRSACEKIKSACRKPEAQVFLLTGGTQTNATVISAILKSYQGVVSASTGHIATHEAGAVEACGHKVLTLPSHNGKIDAAELSRFLADYDQDANHDHIVMPGMVYISHPTEYGTLYSHSELEEISRICRQHHIPLYLDGARLAYALACPQNDLSLQDLAALCDVFYIGGTKCGALFGEAVVITVPGLIPHFFTIIKQHGALLAKGRLLGIQFDTLFTNHLYEHIGKSAISAADQIRDMLKSNGFQLCYDSPTNQIFCIIDNSVMDRLLSQVECSFWEKYDDSHTVIRFVTSWATTQEDVQRLGTVLSFCFS